MTVRKTPLKMTESELMEAVRQLAALRGWHYLHHYDSRRSAPGWPDCVMVRGPRMVCAELKSEIGKATEAQMIWLEVLAQVPGIECHLWRPADLRSGEIDKVLR